jgi:hypothetical protein
MAMEAICLAVSTVSIVADLAAEEITAVSGLKLFYHGKWLRS